VLVRRSAQPVIVIEAIKLLESELRQQCDSVWVTAASFETQLARLIQKRGMPEAAARQRIAAQPPQDAKVAAADVVIQNEHSFDDSWQQVVAAWGKIGPAAEAVQRQAVSKPAGRARGGAFIVERGRPRQAEEIAAFLNRYRPEKPKLSRVDVMAAFGEKAFMLLRQNGRLAGLAGWQVENLVARTGDITLDPDLTFPEAMQAILREVERASRELQCEISLLFLPPEFSVQAETWQALGYQPRTVQSLGVRAWQEAAMESMPPGAVLLFKQLRKDRVLRPV
jgi:dephospho-CoA kinase